MLQEVENKLASVGKNQNQRWPSVMTRFDSAMKASYSFRSCFTLQLQDNCDTNEDIEGPVKGVQKLPLP